MIETLRRALRAPLGSLAVALLAGGASAHEYWIAPAAYRVEPGERVEARLLVGQMMEGAELPWLSHQIKSFRIMTANGEQPAEGMEGDVPALGYVADTPGLNIIAQQTHPLELTYDNIDEFRDYLDWEGLGEIVGEHRRRGLPEADFSEAYSRFAKALVQVGPVEADDLDRPVGFDYELVALENPYAGAGTLPVLLTWQGTPEAGTQIAIFRRGEGGPVERTLVTTDAEGRATIPIGAGGEFLLNAVHLEPVDGKDVVWDSSWASLTFGLPQP